MKKCILVISKDQIFRHGLEAVLHNEHIRLYFGESVEEALYATQKFDII